MINNKYYVVAGPCSAESLSQLEETVKGLSQIKQVDMIRCGVWKPRSRPGGFQGVGEEALNWIQQIKSDNTSLKFAIETALPRHVELALKYGIDAIWVGARTVSNPFLVQELAASLRGVSISVMVKNPIAPDIKLWMGAIERFRNAGLPSLWAIHRGFATLTPYGLRNAPLWTIPLELKRNMPDVPMLCDPSHLGGDASLIERISKEALLVGFDGIMVETHANPSKALTDARQQITPSELSTMIGSFETMFTKLELRDKNEVALKERISILENEKALITSELNKSRAKYEIYLKEKPKT